LSATWCQLASVENAFRALGDETVNQELIAREARVHRDESPFPAKLMKFASDQGMEVHPVDSVTGMLDAIVSGKKVVLHAGPPAVGESHDTLASGVRMDHGRIEFLSNDPVTTGMTPVSLETVLSLLQPPFNHNKKTGSYSISRPEVAN
jgi:anti-sigma factor RsiW